MPLKQALIVCAGGAVGALIRWRLSFYNAPASLPLGTLVANLLGCLGLGLVMGVLRPNSLLLLFLAAGVCGALTTFSTFAYELASARPWTGALSYALLSLVGGLLAVVLGLRLGRLMS